MPKNNKKSEIIEPGASIFVTLDDISLKLSKLIKVQVEALKTASKDRELLLSILKELKDGVDEGEYFRQEATANPTTYDIIDFLAILGFSVKGFTLINDGVNTILYGHNITDLSIDTSIHTQDARFLTLVAGEDVKITYNRKCIRHIYLIAVGGNSAYRLTALW